MAVELKVDEGLGKQINAFARQLFKTPANVTIMVLCAIISVLLLLLYREDVRNDAREERLLMKAEKREQELRAEAKEIRNLFYECATNSEHLSRRVLGLQDTVAEYQRRAISRGGP